MGADDGAATDRASGPRLGSRILVTWVELTVIWLAGGLLGTAVGGPPSFVLYLGTSLLSVAILLYNVDALVRARLAASGLRGAARDDP